MKHSLYRGKRIDNGTWVEGFYIVLYGTEDLHIIVDDHGEYHRVDPETVGQHTGNYDKNGKKIFEGDICRTKGYALIDEKPFEVVWNDYYSGWYWQDIEVSRETDALTKTVAELTEVIGNIHDNPELMKGLQR